METIRQKQVAELIRRNFSMVLSSEGKYIYEDAMVTVTGVKMSPDMSLAKIYVSIYNYENKQEVILMMEEHYARLKQAMHQRLKKQLRLMPEFRFYLDETLDEVYRLEALFKKLHEEKQFGEE
ncbi:MAG: 30S ribosome-binding factor RbfA [Saprospiraceae bacterium]|nr:30S ribosome-binding factor RbfA [Candidatus Vicinibacter affinis]MBK7882056.1 30S ribosome-binding factor RbfA [Candidatus Vicinibacter proximus]MBL7822943.1 30S ribosome-binding factor RbfA [Saprospiraceae bacterium]MBK6573763.1 30S ribosome-binding factor RbfA [Candidatus Vicinibacter affinis]MBK6821787.1 30S ribosome-binding factor RbfA [Candidatus Vicinibacter affinis]